jgi:hypothetical protein
MALEKGTSREYLMSLLRSQVTNANLAFLLSEQKDIDNFKEKRRSKVTKQMDGNA